MIRDDLRDRIAAAVASAQREGALPSFEPPPVIIERPKDPSHGDYATAICMVMARQARMAPLQIAEKVLAYLERPPSLAEVSVAPPGYINMRLADEWLTLQVERILQYGERFGQVDLGQGRRVQVEFISANPTGPLTIGSGRNAVIGDTLANILQAAGYRVEREYYINDTGNQMLVFARSLYSRYVQALGGSEPFPEDGYPGAYVVELAQAIAAEHGDRFMHLERERALAAIQKEGLRRMVAQIRADAEALNVHFDVWKSEQSLYSDGIFEDVFKRLKAGGWVVEREGAIWFKGEGEEDKENVIIRSDGRPTYFASDIAYVWDKLVLRGFDWAIYVWGADHHGHVPRLKGVTRALGLDEKRVTVILYQLVTLKRAGELVRMGKRTGEIITLREVLEEVGTDATRFMLLTRSADSQMELDLTLAAQQSSENPVYYVQYGHARIASIFRKAAQEGLSMESGDPRLLQHPSELALLRQMLRLEETVALCAETLAPHHLTFYAQEVASSFHAFYRDCRVVSDAPRLSAARLKLVMAAKITLANTLRLMGMSAPETM